MNQNSVENHEEYNSASMLIMGASVLVLLLMQALFWQVILENETLITNFISPLLWQWLLQNVFAGELVQLPGLEPYLVVSWTRCLIFAVVFWGIVELIVYLGTRFSSQQSDRSNIRNRQLWWSLPAVWYILWMIGSIAIIPPLVELLSVIPQFVISITIAGCLTGFLPASAQGSETKVSYTIPWQLIAVMLIYVLIFVSMNWGLWFNLRIPHGDSAMYEEHLWNVLHGKGFRSYLDQGLFWGEHIQFIHLFLIPIYAIWPSHLLLELVESVALASGAIPMFWMTKRTTKSQSCAFFLATAYLLYFPMQFLDIAVDLKTFRPIALGVPVFLFALDQLDRQNYRIMGVLLLLTLTAKEDYSITFFCLGVWLVSTSLFAQRPHWKSAIKQPACLAGLILSIASPLYLLSALKLIRWFRSGVEVHYAGYFSKFGESTTEIIFNMITQPGLLIGELATLKTAIYLLAILVPIAGLPLLSPTRFLVGVPLLILLCLNELAQDPRHHFHAPLIPILFWASAHGIANIPQLIHLMKKNLASDKKAITSSLMNRWAQLACLTAFTTGFWFTLSPLGFPFWDFGSQWKGQALYVPDERARKFQIIKDVIPKEARVASTDFVHPRFTHHERSYDYSQYARTVSGGTTDVPEDTDYIVIDTRHPYSDIRSISDIRERQQQPEQWEVIPDETEGYYIILKRIN